MFSFAPALPANPPGGMGGPNPFAGLYEILDGPWHIEPIDENGHPLGELRGWVESTIQGLVAKTLTSTEVLGDVDGNGIAWVGPGVSWTVTKDAQAGAALKGYRRCAAIVTGDLPPGVQLKFGLHLKPLPNQKRAGFHTSEWCEITSSYNGVDSVGYVHFVPGIKDVYAETFYFPAGFQWVTDNVTWVIKHRDVAPNTNGLHFFTATLTLS